MELSAFLKSVIDADDVPVVICDINHDIVYMNPSSIKKYGGRDITGKSIFDCHNGESVEKLNKAVGYEPTTTIEEGMPRFCKWYKEWRENHPED